MDWIKRLAVWSVVIGTIVLGLEYFAYYLTGSIALYSDALESIVNVAIIRIVQVKGRKDRHVMLSPETLDLLWHGGRCDRLATIRACRKSSADCFLAASQESR